VYHVNVVLLSKLENYFLFLIYLIFLKIKRMIMKDFLILEDEQGFLYNILVDTANVCAHNSNECNTLEIDNVQVADMNILMSGM